MLRFIRSTSLPIALLLAGTSVVHAQSGRGSPAQGVFEVGRPAPTLELPAIDGRMQIDQGALRGRRLILLQFASW